MSTETELALGTADIEADEKLAQHIERFLFEVHDEGAGVEVGASLQQVADDLQYFSSPASQTTETPVLDDRSTAFLTAELLQAQLGITSTPTYESPASHLIWDDNSESIDIECFSALEASLFSDVDDLGTCASSTSTGPYSTPTSPKKPLTTLTAPSPLTVAPVTANFAAGEPGVATRRTRRVPSGDAKPIASVQAALSLSAGPGDAALQRRPKAKDRRASPKAPRVKRSGRRVGRAPAECPPSWPTTLINYDDDDEEIDIVS